MSTDDAKPDWPGPARPGSGPRNAAVPTLVVGLDGVIRGQNPVAVALLGLGADDPSPPFDSYLGLTGDAPRPIIELAAQSVWTIHAARILQGPHAGQMIRFRARGVADRKGRLKHVVVVGETGIPGRAASKAYELAEAPVKEESGPISAAVGSGGPGRTFEPSWMEQGDPALSVVEELLGEAGHRGHIDAQMLLDRMLDRFRLTEKDVAFEFSADATWVPIRRMPAISALVQEIVSLLLADRRNIAKGEMLRLLMWSSEDGVWRIVARLIGARRAAPCRSSERLDALIVHLGGSALPEGLSGSGIALAFPPFAEAATD